MSAQATPASSLAERPLRERVITEILAERAAAMPDAPFIHVHDDVHTYGRFHTACRELAGAFAELGVEPGDRVVLMLRNRLEFLQSWFAVASLGATIVPINPDWKGETLSYILTDADPTAIVLSADLLEVVDTVLDSLDGLRAVVVCDAEAVHERAGGPRRLPWSGFEKLGSPHEPDAGPRHDDVLAILYSSGTTGRPKGIMLPHAHVYSFGVNWIACANLREGDVLYSPLSLFYMQPMILGVVPVLMVGAEVHVAERFTASRYWEHIRATGATIAHGQFTLIPLLLKQPPSPLDREHRCDRIFIGKSNEEFETRFGARLIEIYGSTESNLVTFNPYDAHKPGSSGKAAPGFELRIVDDDGQELPCGEVGELIFRPSEPFSVSYGYYNNPDATLEAWRHLWFHLGDRGYIDDDGYFFFVDRKKDVIRRRGENISSQELERQVTAHPGVLSAAAIPVPAEGGEDEAKVVVVLEQGETLAEADLLDELAARLPRFMVPRYVEYVDALPMTPSMKVQKFALRERGLTPTTWDRDAGAYVADVT